MRRAFLACILAPLAACVGGSATAGNADTTTTPAAQATAQAAPRAVVRTTTPTLQGYWRGAIVRGGALQELALWLDQPESGSLRLRVDVPNWNLVQFAVEHTAGDGQLSFRLGRATVTLAADISGGTMSGTLERPGKDGPTQLAVHLTRLPAPDVAPVVQTAIEFPSADGVTLTGTLVLPEGDGPFPGLVLVQGRSYGPGFQFLGHAVRAARRGVAAIVFNGRGVAGSGGERGKHTLQHRLDDAMAAFDTLAGHPRVAPDRVGMLGHSAGGWVAPVLAHQTGRIAFVVMHSGPAVDLAEQQAQVVRELMKRSGGEFSEQDYADAFAYQKALTRLAMDAAPWAEIAAHVATAEGRPWAEIADRPKDYEDNGSVGYFRRVPHDSDEALAALTVPVLAVYGADDFVVPPEHNVPVLESALRRAGNRDFEIVVFPRANHDLMVEGGDGTDGNAASWAHRPPLYFETLLDFVDRATRR